MNTPSGTQAKQAADDAQDSTAVRTLARFGYAANGLVHILIGVIALQVARGGGGSADQSGALGALSSTPGGTVVLWVCTVGLFGLALWGILEAFLVVKGDTELKKWGSRLKEAAKAVVYAALGVTALRFAMGDGSSSSQSSKSASAQLLSAPGGVVLLVLVGVIVLAIGGVFVYRGVSKKFLENVAEPGGTAGTVVTWLGIVGYTAKGIVLGALGVLLIVAAVKHDPEQAGGLDEALKSLTELPFGVFLLGFVAVGLIAYGVFCFARARWPRL
ncbi:hypothetical protein ASF48_16595 [Rathayibacter sp. Leaf299]|uniref:DUF1206 domain-containing protein n=1 Tax=Rathayibacter sp. Leaf299 TaxID=1736328 RepID=UPI0006F613E7|nr:DUF1206 domain-containing protein [Rathayibacter sp. Leaf299]KQQ18959.1 hypothetical protein ASF48_16595 [Rathayibacter sp. Leaf299]